MSRETFKDNFQQRFKSTQATVASADTLTSIQAIPTGILSFDAASGIGGFPRGRVVEVFGPESGGKSLLTLVSVVYAQKMDLKATALYFDIEGGTPREWLSTLGVDLSRFDIVAPGLTAEQNFDTIIDAIHEGEYTYIIIDSVAGLIPKAELEGKIEKDYMATLARVQSKGVKKVVEALSSVKESAPCVIFINQIRERPGIIYGPSEVTPGGKALLFYSAQRYRVARKSQSEKRQGGDVVGHSIVVKNYKNKLAPPKREGEFYISYTCGVDTVATMMTMLRSRKIYRKEGQKYVLPVSSENTLQFDRVSDLEKGIRDNTTFQEEIYDLLMAKYTGKNVENFLDTGDDGVKNSDTEDDLQF